jgi:hypothetical protein
LTLQPIYDKLHALSKYLTAILTILALTYNVQGRSSPRGGDTNEQKI